MLDGSWVDMGFCYSSCTFGSPSAHCRLVEAPRATHFKRREKGLPPIRRTTATFTYILIHRGTWLRRLQRHVPGSSTFCLMEMELLRQVLLPRVPNAEQETHCPQERLALEDSDVYVVLCSELMSVRSRGILAPRGVRTFIPQINERHL